VLVVRGWRGNIKIEPRGNRLLTVLFASNSDSLDRLDVHQNGENRWKEREEDVGKLKLDGHGDTKDATGNWL